MKHDRLTLIDGTLGNLTIPSSGDISSGSLSTNGGNLVLGTGAGLEIVTALGRSFDAALRGRSSATSDGNGQLPPELAQIKKWYSTASFDVEDPAQFSYSEATGLQKLAVPFSGLYKIVCAGRGSPSSAHSGTVELTVLLEADDVLTVVCGQGSSSQSAGCGATYISSMSLGLLAVGGGVGGFYLSPSPADANARIDIENPGIGVSGISHSVKVPALANPAVAVGGAGWLTTRSNVGNSISPVVLSSLSGPFGGTTYSPRSGAGAPMTRRGGFGGGGGDAYLSYTGYIGDMLGGGGGFSGGRGGSNISGSAQSAQGGTCFAARGDKIRSRKAYLSRDSENASIRSGLGMVLISLQDNPQ